MSHGVYVSLHTLTTYVLSDPRGMAMIVIGSIIGGIIALVIFMISALSFPMLMDRRTDIFTAVATSIAAFRKAPGTMLLWGWLIAFLVAAGCATFFVGLAVVFPLIGHATWHAYREIVGDL